ncbi:MAG TPA: DHA2 family efflux MFS transporter permease subunit [Actinocrinis sp.]|jgi:EmrB/QacA subfamily drug resistance transporter
MVQTVSPGPGTQEAGPPRKPQLGWTLMLTSFAYFMVALDSLVVVTALPSIQHDLGAPLTSAQWTINAYGLTWAAGIILAAVLGDMLGRRRVFIAGVALFTVSSAACALSGSMGVLIGFRAVQGLGAAVILPLSLTILAGVFPPQKRGAMIGIWGGIGGLAVACGPLVGGVLTDDLNWHWIFWLNVPIGVVVALLTRLRIAESRGPAAHPDLPGVALVTAGAATAVWSLVHASIDGWGNGATIGGLVAGAVLITGFVLWEKWTPNAMLPLRLFRSMTFSSASATSFAMTAALLSAGVYVTQYFQLASGESALAAGVRVLPMMIMPLLVTPLAGIAADRVGHRTLIVSGLMIECVGLGWFALTEHVGTSYSALIVPLALTGMGLSMAMATTPTALLNAVARQDMGKASGVNGTLQRFGGAFGVAVTTAVFASAAGHAGSASGVSTGIRSALLGSAGLALLGALTGLGIRGVRPAGAAPAAPAPRAAAPVAAGADR